MDPGERVRDEMNDPRGDDCQVESLGPTIASVPTIQRCMTQPIKPSFCYRTNLFCFSVFISSL